MNSYVATSVAQMRMNMLFSFPYQFFGNPGVQSPSFGALYLHEKPVTEPT